MGATSEQFDLWVALRLKDQGLKAGLAATATAASGAKAEVAGLDKAASKAGSTFKWLAGAAGFAGLTGTVMKGAQKFAEYERGMLKVQTMLGKGQDVFKMYGSGISELSRRYAVGSSEITAGLYQALSANVDTSKAMQFMDVASKMAVGGFTDTATAVDGLTSVMNAYGYSLSRTDHVANVFAVTQKQAKTTIGEMAAVMGLVAPLAAQVGVEFESVAAALGTATKRGLGMAPAAAALRQLIANMVKPPHEAKKALEELGIQWGEETLRSKGLVGSLQYLKDAVKGNNAEIGRVLGSVEALNLAMILTSESGVKDFAGLMAEAKINTTELDGAVDTVTRGVGHKLKRMELAFGSVTKKIGESFFDQLGMFDQTEAKVLEFADSIGSAFGTVAKNLDVIVDTSERLLVLWGTAKGAAFLSTFLGRMGGGAVAAGAAGAAGAAVTTAAAGAAGAAGAGMLGKLGGAVAKATPFLMGGMVAYEVGSIVANVIEAKQINALEGYAKSKFGVTDVEAAALSSGPGALSQANRQVADEILARRAAIVERTKETTYDVDAEMKLGNVVPTLAAERAMEELEKFDASIYAVFSGRRDKVAGQIAANIAAMAESAEISTQGYANAGDFLTDLERGRSDMRVSVALEHKFEDTTKDKDRKGKSHTSVRARIDRGEGQARLVSPEYRMTLVREGAGGLVTQPLQDDVIDVAMLDVRG